jgi:hypothetical protein
MRGSRRGWFLQALAGLGAAALASASSDRAGLEELLTQVNTNLK